MADPGGGAGKHKLNLSRVEVVVQRYPGTAGTDAERAASLPFKLHVAGKVSSGKSGANGSVVAYVPAGTPVVLEILETRLQLVPVAKLEKEDTVRGRQRRLQLLGYELGSVDGVVGPKTGGATLQFQADNAPIDTTGAVGADTQQRLVTQFGE